jgi:hypothetical protein
VTVICRPLLCAYQREALLDLLLGVLDLDPKTRWTPRQAIKHPFITGRAHGLLNCCYPYAFLFKLCHVTDVLHQALLGSCFILSPAASSAVKLNLGSYLVFFSTQELFVMHWSG